MTIAAKTAYLSITDAQTYFNGKLNTDAWDDATTADQTKSLIQASTQIDSLNYKGDYLVRSDPINGTGTTQEHEFPRDYQPTGVPLEVLYACCEIALWLLDGGDPEQEVASGFSASQSYAEVRESYNGTNMAARCGMPTAAFNFLMPHLRDPRSLCLTHV